MEITFKQKETTAATESEKQATDEDPEFNQENMN